MCPPAMVHPRRSTTGSSAKTDGRLQQDLRYLAATGGKPDQLMIDATHLKTNLTAASLIDKQFLETPFYGVRQMTWHLRNKEHLVNEKRIRRLMRLMGLMPLYQKPNTNKAAKGHKVYPYLLRGLRVDRPNQVWCADITYLRCGAGSPTWWPSWTGTRARFWRGGYRTHWKRSTVSKP